MQAKGNQIESIRCPRCDSEAYNQYGRIKNGKQRYICLVCNRQFVAGSASNRVPERPACVLCGKKMHVYMRDENVIRFRCSGYPVCRGYMKTAKAN